MSLRPLPCSFLVTVLVGLLVITNLVPAFAQSTAQSTHASLIRSHLEGLARKEWPDAEISVSVDLDPRLRLKPCTRPLISLRGQQRHGRVHVALKCGAPSAWSVYIPAEISVRTEVLVANRALPRGHTLSGVDVRTEKRLLQRSGPAVLKPGDSVNGLITKRTIPSGSVLTLPLFAAAQAVKNGEIVQLASGAGPIRISTKGKVLKDGRVGDQIPVENITSGKTVQAWVIAPGEVSTRPLANR